MSKTIYRSIYDAIHSDLPVSAVREHMPQTVSLGEIDEWTRDQHQLEIIPVWGDHLAEASNRLAEIDIAFGSLAVAASDTFESSAAIAEHFRAEDIAARLRNAEAKHRQPIEASIFFDKLRQVQGGFSRLAAALGYAYTLCPFTGDIIRSNHTIPVAIDSTKQVCIFYYFKSKVNFYVIVSSWSGGKEYIYIPSKNILLRLHEHWFAWGDASHMIAEFMSLLVKHAEIVADYYAGPTNLALLGNTMDNLGHFFWNDAAGFDAFSEEGFLSKARHLVCYRHNPIKISDLFSDLFSDYKKDIAVDAVDLLQKTVGSGLFVVRPCFYKIEPRLAARITAYAMARTSKAQTQAINSARTHEYVMWINFRTHNKSLVNLVDVSLGVVDRLLQRYGSVAIFADGFPDCYQELESFAARLPKRVTLYRGLNLDICDSIHWASKVDSYIATIGSGLTLVTWIAGRFGIAHSEPAHLNQMQFWHHVRPDVPPPITPAISDIRSIGDDMYANYEIEPDIFIKLLETVFEREG